MKTISLKDLLRFSTFLLFLVVAPTLALADDGEVIKSTGEGWINWSEGSVFARGEGFAPPNTPAAQGRAMAFRAAVVTAQRNLLEITQGVRIDSETIVKDAMVESDVIRSRVEGIVKGAQIYERRCGHDGSCEVLLGMKLSSNLLGPIMQRSFISSNPYTSNPLISYLRNPGKLLDSLAEALVPSAYAALKNRYSKEELETLKKLLSEANSSENQKAFIKDLEGAIGNLESMENVTGILIDASAVPDFDLAVNPVIKTSEGVEVYPGDFVTYENAVRLRPVTYKLTVDGAVNDKRIFNVPYQAKALGIYKKKRSDLVVSQGDADKILQLGKNTQLLENCKVVVVVGQ